MGKQLNLTKSEQNKAANSIKEIAEILSSKMDGGVTKPGLEGTLLIENEGRKLYFQFELKKEDPNAEA